MCARARGDPNLLTLMGSWAEEDIGTNNRARVHGRINATAQPPRGVHHAPAAMCHPLGGHPKHRDHQRQKAGRDRALLKLDRKLLIVNLADSKSTAPATLSQAPCIPLLHIREPLEA